MAWRFRARERIAAEVASSDDKRASLKATKPPGPTAAFGALVAAASRDPAAARGLASAYATLDGEQRHGIVDAVVKDASAEGVCASLVLASLLAVEEDTEVARHIADAMSMLDSPEAGIRVAARALVAGDERQGGVLIIRPLHGTFVEVLALAWDGDGAGVTHSHFEPLVHHDHVTRIKRHLPSYLMFEEVPLTYAIDLVTAPLWTHRRQFGQLPDGMARFADLFSVDQPLRES